MHRKLSKKTIVIQVVAEIELEHYEALRRLADSEGIEFREMLNRALKCGLLELPATALQRASVKMSNVTLVEWFEKNR